MRRLSFGACLAPRPPFSSARSFTHSAVPIALFAPVQRPSRPLLSTCNGAQTRKAAPSGSRTISRAHTAATNSSSAAASGGGGGAKGSRSCHLFDWRQRSDGRCAAGAEHMGGASLLPMQLLQPFVMLGAPCKWQPVVRALPCAAAATPPLLTLTDLHVRLNPSYRWPRMQGWTLRWAAAREPAACAR